MCINSLGGEMVDTRDSKSRAAKRGGSSPLQGIDIKRFEYFKLVYLVTFEFNFVFLKL